VTAGKERLRVVLKKLVPEVVQAQFGNPVTGETRFDLCLYDGARTLVGSLTVDRAAATCGTKSKPCWNTLSNKGYRFKDPSAAADGVRKIVAKGGATKRSKVAWRAGNKAAKGRIGMPTGLTAALQGTSEVTVQVLTSDGGCFGGTSTDVSRADAQVFEAAGPLR
jgi:hypothetical protein